MAPPLGYTSIPLAGALLLQASPSFPICSPPPAQVSLIIDEIKNYEGFQETAKVGGRHQACDRPVALSTGPFGDSRKSTLFHNDNLGFHSVTTLMVTSIRTRLVRSVHDGLGDFAIQTGQVDISA